MRAPNARRVTTEGVIARAPVSHPWFVRRKIGLGWRPASWEGWAVTAAAVALIAGIDVVAHRSAGTRLAIAIVVIAVYAVVVALTAGDRSRPAVSDDASAPTADPGSSGSVQLGSPRPGGAEPAPLELPRRATPVGPAVLVVDHLTKAFGDRVAVSDVSFTIASGEVFGFLGPNGAGKTTTVRTLGTLIEPTSGSAQVAGIPLAPENGVEIRQRISIMSEAPGLYLRLTVRENLEFFAGLYGIANPAGRIASALDAVNLGDRASDNAGSLSKGLRQRVGLARALLNDPAIIFLDEPTSGLDPVASREVHELIGGLRERGVTIFLTTHRLDEAERLCDRVAITNTTLRTIGRPDELRDELFVKALHVVTVAPLESPDRVFARLPGVEGWRRDDNGGGYLVSVSDPRAAAPALTRALVAAGADVLSIGESKHSLEDVYLELVTEDVEALRR